MNPELRGSLGVVRAPLIVLGMLLGVFLLIPLVIIVPTSWTAGLMLEFPPRGFSLQWYARIFDDTRWTDAFVVSLRTSILATAMATISGTAAALAVRRLGRTTGARLLNSLFIVPLAIPYVAYALGLYNMFAGSPELSNSTWPLICGQAVITFPLVYIVVSSGLAAVDPALARAASTMGARWPTVVWRIELPLIRLSILAAALFAFVTCFDEATLPIFIAPVDQATLPQTLYSAARESIAPTLSAVSTAVTLLAFLVLGGGNLLVRRAAAITTRRTRQR